MSVHSQVPGLPIVQPASPALWTSTTRSASAMPPSLLRLRCSGNASVLEVPLLPSDERLSAAYSAAFGAPTVCCQNVMCGPICVPLGLAVAAQELYMFMPHKQSGEVRRQRLHGATYHRLCEDVSATEMAVLADGPLLLLFLTGGRLHVYDMQQLAAPLAVIHQHEDLHSPHLPSKQLSWSDLPPMLRAQTVYGFGLCRAATPKTSTNSRSSNKKARVDELQEQGAVDAQQLKLLSVTQLRLSRLRTKNDALRCLAAHKQAVLWSVRDAISALAKGEAYTDTLPRGVLKPLGAADTPLQPAPHVTSTRGPREGMVEIVEVLPCPEGGFCAIRVRNGMDCAAFNICASVALSAGSRGCCSCSTAPVLLPGDEAMLMASADFATDLQLLLSYCRCLQLNREAIGSRTLVSTADPSAAYLSLSEADAMQRRTSMLPLGANRSAAEQQRPFSGRLLASLQSATGNVSLHGFLLGVTYFLSNGKKDLLLAELLEALAAFLDSGRLAHYLLCGSRLAWFDDYPSFLRGVTSRALPPRGPLAAMLCGHLPTLSADALHCSSSYTAASCDVLLDALLDEFKLLSILWRKQQQRSSKRSHRSLLFFAAEESESPAAAGGTMIRAASGLQASARDVRLLLSMQRQTDDLAARLLIGANK